MLEPQYLGGNTWRIAWTSGLEDPTFTIYLDGELFATTAATHLDLYVEPGSSPVLEVVDDGAAASQAFPGRLRLQWGREDDTDHYLIEEVVDAAWTERARVRDDGRQYFHWLTRWLEDSTSHQFRVTPIGTNGNAGTAVAFTCLMVRHPDPPDVSMSYDEGTGDLTVSAA